jgi:HlyD family secretion protein
MDIPKSRKAISSKRRRRYLVLAAAAVCVAAALAALSALKTAAPTVDASALWIGTVQEGEMARELRGVGELVPDDDAARWLAAELDGRVDRKFVEAGAIVTPDTMVLQLSNPEVEQAAVSAKLALDAAEAAYASLDAALQNDLLALRSATAAIEADRVQAEIQAEVDVTLARDGLLSNITSRQSTVRAQALAARMTLEQNRVEATERSLASRLATQRADVESRRTLAVLRQRDLESMRVRAGMAGVLQEIVVEVGQRVTRSANLARVVDPARLKAVVRIPEAQTRDLRVGLPATIDTRSGVVAGQVTRIAPSAQNGTVTVDIDGLDELPPGARLDMSIDGVIELERLVRVRHVGRPAAGQTEGAVTLFKLSPDGREAVRVPVRLGRASANEVEIVDGDLTAGDRVVLSDTSAWSGERVRLN